MGNLDRHRARNKLLLTLAIILFGAFLGTSLINYALTREAVHQEIVQKELPLTLDNINSEILSEILKPVLVASSMASDTFLIDWALDGETEVERVTRYLEKIRERYKFFTTFFVSAKTLNYYHFNGIHKVITPQDSHDIWYYRFIKDNKEYALDVDNDEASQNVLTVFINYKVFDQQGDLLGVTGVGLRVDMLAELIGEYQQKYDRSVYLTNMAGVVQVHENRELIEQKSITQLEGIAPLAGQILVLDEAPANFQFKRQGEDILLSVRYLKPLDWLLYVEQSETRALSLARSNLIRTILIGIGVSMVIIVLTLFTINRYQLKIEQMATRDVLTGIANRRVLEDEFVRALYIAKRYTRPFSLILMDLDGFKEVNDSLGHLAGDQVLKRIADIVSMTVRPVDTVARWGGDEFVVLSSLAAHDAKMIAERIRKYVAESNLAEAEGDAKDARSKITICCGIAEYQVGDTLDTLLYRADQAMYQCKEMGGNGVVIAEVQ